MSDTPDEAGRESKAEEEHVPEGEVIYRAIRKDGDHALGLTVAELAWSGVAAGLSMGFSLAAEGILRAHLPDAAWRPLVAKFGYAIGFLIVILGRQQLFTEQTLTAVLSLLSKDRPRATLGNVARLWSIVLVANLIGVGVFAAFSAWTPVFTPDVHAAFSAIGEEALAPGFTATFVRAMYAGFLIATMVWLLPGSGESRLWIVVIIAWVVGIGQFAHVIAGSGEGLYVVFTGEQTLTAYLARFLLPSFLGNSVGGVALVASLAHAQHAPE
jgi:formate/nitrite transporter FocA (FNT family)